METAAIAMTEVQAVAEDGTVVAEEISVQAVEAVVIPTEPVQQSRIRKDFNRAQGLFPSLIQAEQFHPNPERSRVPRTCAREQRKPTASTPFQALPLTRGQFPVAPQLIRGTAQPVSV